MGQAKTFTEAEFDRLLAFIATQSHAARNRAMALMTFWTDLRVGGLAQLCYSDVFEGHDRARTKMHCTRPEIDEHYAKH